MGHSMMQQSGKRRGTQQNDPERAAGDTGTTGKR